MENTLEFSKNSFLAQVSELEKVHVEESKENEEGFLNLPDLKSIIHKKLKIEYHQGKPYYVIKSNAQDAYFNRFIKRVFDIFFSVVVIVFLLSWLTPLLSILILIDSKGPIFYKQKRTGKNNRVFECLKFRTMTYIKNDVFVPAIKNDKRVTTLGKFLRKTSIDEFPQFFNVFVGEMSVVGPRPHPLKLNDDFKHKVDRYLLRNVVKPGITGLSQAKGFRGEVSDTLTMRQRIKIDMFYIENWTFWLDLKIIALTIYNLFKGDKNAY